MPKMRCWIFGHDRINTPAAHGVCLRCGRREARPDLARAPVPFEKTPIAAHGRFAGMHVQADSTQGDR